MDGQNLEAQDPFAPIPPDEPEPEAYDKSRTYWALWKGRDLVQALEDKQEAYFESARNRGLLAMWVIAYATYHGLTPDDLRDFATQQIGFQGDELELIRFHINLIRPYARHQTSLALGEPAAFKAMVVNSDHTSQIKAELQDRIVTSLHKRYCAEHDMPAAESDGVFGSGNAHFRWDFEGGDLVQVPVDVLLPDGSVSQHTARQRSGAPVVTVLYPWTCVTEPRMSGGKHLWKMAREKDSVWNLIATFPHLEEAILNVHNGIDKYDFGTLFRLEELQIATKDEAIVLHFYHARCPAVPDGRYTVVYGDVILWDGPCPRKEGVPIASMMSGTFIESAFGYADIWDLISIQQALNQLNSDELQNYATFGRQSVAIEQGTEVTIDSIASGTAFYVPPGARMPQAVQVAAVPATLPQGKDYLHKMLDTVSGQNAASRGDPSPNVRSGEMNALLDSIAIRYQSFRQAAVRNYRIECATILLDMITRYGTNPFLVEITGIESRSYLAEYTRDDLSGVERVTIDVVSPLMQSTAGRMQVFTTLKDLPPEDRNAAYEMIVTGSSSLWLKKDRSEELLIRRENEYLTTGEVQVMVTAGENPATHYPMHFAQRQQLMASDNPDVAAIQRFDEHMLQHIQEWLGMSPLVCQVMGIMPPPPIPPNPQNPMGNPTWQLQAMVTQGAAMMNPMAGVDGGGAPAGGGGPAPQGGGGPKPPAPQPQPAQAAQRNDSGGPQQMHPTGTPLPQPSSPPQGAT